MHPVDLDRGAVCIYRNHRQGALGGAGGRGRSRTWLGVIAAGQGGYHLNGRETHGNSMIVDPGVWC